MLLYNLAIGSSFIYLFNFMFDSSSVIPTGLDYSVYTRFLTSNLCINGKLLFLDSNRLIYTTAEPHLFLFYFVQLFVGVIAIYLFVLFLILDSYSLNNCRVPIWINYRLLFMVEFNV